MTLCQARRRYTKRRTYNKSSCWRNPVTVFFLTFSVLASLRLRVPARSKEAASSLLTKSREWQKQRRKHRIEKQIRTSMDIQYQLLQVTPEGNSPTNVQRYAAVNSSTGEPITVEAWAKSIAEDASKASTMIEVIQQCGFHAVFFETPPVKSSTMSFQPFEFVLLDAPDLYRKAHGQMDTRSFEAFFTKYNAAVVFKNLGGDAVLISPNPVIVANTNNADVEPQHSLNVSFSHLASFVRDAPLSIVTETWRTMAQAYLSRVEEVKDQPVWLSTDGRGVSWLHFRLDERPKYYKYASYKTE